MESICFICEWKFDFNGCFLECLWKLGVGIHSSRCEDRGAFKALRLVTAHTHAYTHFILVCYTHTHTHTLNCVLSCTRNMNFIQCIYYATHTHTYTHTLTHSHAQVHTYTHTHTHTDAGATQRRSALHTGWPLSVSEGRPIVN